MTGLTARQQLVFDSIKGLMATQKRTPSVREIGEAAGIQSPNGVQGHLKALEAKGYITRGRTARSIQLVGAGVCPCCGQAKQQP